MKIAGFNTRVISVRHEVGPLAEGPGATTASVVVLTIRTDDGIEGIGYAGFAGTLMLKALKAAVDSLAEQTIGDDPMMIEALGSKLFTLGGGGAPAGLVTRSIAAIDIALWDIKGQALGHRYPEHFFQTLNPGFPR